MRHFLAGQLAALRDFSLLYAPEHQLLQALPAGLLRADRRRLGPRQPHLRPARRRPRPLAALREPAARRRRQPVPRRRRTVAAGLYGIEQKLELPEACAGNAYTAAYEHVPTTLREAAELWENSPIARAAFGDEVVAHYRNMARVELDAFDAAVTDWELRRSFERM